MRVSAIKQLAKRWLTSAAPEGTTRRVLLRKTKQGLKRYLPNWLGINNLGWIKAVAPPLDVYDPVALHTFLRACRLRPLDFTASQANLDDLGAARFVFGLLQRRPDLRRRFPLALTEGAGGAFCRWLCGEGAAECGLSPNATAAIRDAFLRKLGACVRKLYEYRIDLRPFFPLALTPAGQRPFLRWLLLARAELGLTAEEVLWFAFECAEDPARGIATTYLMTPAWQEKYPHGLTRFGRRALLAWVRKHYGIKENWSEEVVWPDVLHPEDELRLLYRARPDLRALAPQAFADAHDTRRLMYWLRQEENAGGDHRQEIAGLDGKLDELGVNVLAHFCYPSGLQEAARSTVDALGRAGIRTFCRNVPANIKLDTPDHRDYLGLEVFDHTLLHLAPEPLVEVCYPLCGLARPKDVYRIAVWYWELEAVPAEWVKHARLIQEIWAPTRFIADAMRKVMPIPVVHMLGGAELKPFPSLPRSHFGLPDEQFLFLFMFDMNSIMERKNPLGLIRAYQQAFGRDGRTQLAVKVTRGEVEPENLSRLQQAAEEAGAIVINQAMTREESYALMNTCDCYVSLHRSEGFGFTMAEAMLMGKPVIGTAYSGNMDFMTPDNSLLVDYRRIPITQQLPFYRKGCLWADPDLDQAAKWMRWVFEHSEAARALGGRARVEAGRLLSLDAAGARMARRLEELRAERVSGGGSRRAA